VNYQYNEIRKNILQPLHFLEEDIKSANDLYNYQILNEYLTRDKHTKLHRIFLQILDNSKVIANRLKTYDFHHTQLNKIVNGYSHQGNFTFHYFYEGGDSVCEHQDVAPFYIKNETFDPETALDKKIANIKIVIPFQKRDKKSLNNKNQEFEYEVNDFLKLLSEIIIIIRSNFQ